MAQHATNLTINARDEVPDHRGRIVIPFPKKVRGAAGARVVADRRVIAVYLEDCNRLGGWKGVDYRLLCWIANHVYLGQGERPMKNKIGFCFAHQDTMARGNDTGEIGLGVSPSTIDRSIQRLKALGLIQVTQRRDTTALISLRWPGGEGTPPKRRRHRSDLPLGLSSGNVTCDVSRNTTDDVSDPPEASLKGLPAGEQEVEVEAPSPGPAREPEGQQTAGRPQGGLFEEGGDGLDSESSPRLQQPGPLELDHAAIVAAIVAERRAGFAAMLLARYERQLGPDRPAQWRQARDHVAMAYLNAGRKGRELGLDR